jgi:para-nitrobenzyl esterase
MPLIRTAKTESGVVRGLPAADPRVTSYKGIPFAAPPVGENRWRAPQPCVPWKGELTAYDFGPITPQAVTGKNKENLYSREWWVDDDPRMDEDCLYMNIWAPAEGQAGLPVFVWYFGGGLQVGATLEMEFDGERIARRGAVVVTINYRLNVFGFLAHPELTAEAPQSPTNFGFLDQQFGTQWVKRNIAAFGGDPENITIGGQSAGGMSVSAQIAHRQNEGLFHRAVIVSGLFAPAYPDMFGLCVPLREAEERGERFFRNALGIRTLEEARRLTWQRLLDAALAWKDAGLWPAAVDSVFLHYAPDCWYLHEDRVHCPVMMGSTNNEFHLAPRAEDDASLRVYAARLPGLDQESFLALFSSPATKESIQSEGEVNAIAFAVRAAGMKAKDAIYAYEFCADIPGWDHPGAFHSVDLWFFFETLAKCWRPFTGKHYDLARQMCDYLFRFVSDGDPNGTGTDGARLPYWPALQPQAPVFMSFGDTAKPVQSPPDPVTKLLLDAYLAANKTG